MAKKTTTKPAAKTASKTKIVTNAKSIAFFEKYINNASPTSYEKSGQKIWLDYIRPLVDETYVDNYGTAVGIINPKAPYKVVIEAHADEISWYVNYITSDGLIYVIRNGGSDHQIAPSMRVNIHTDNGIVNGVFGWPAIHTRSGEKEEAPSLKNIFTYTTNNTYTKSGTDVRQLRVICVGGGGGGRGYGESGGAGGFAELWLDATSITTVTVTIGGGGGGGVYYGYSPSGNTTSFGGFCSASGGNGANNNQDHTGGQGGIGSGGNLNFHGGGGRGHINCHTSSHHNPGHGGNSFFGGSTPGVHYTSRSQDNSAFGAGGTGSNFYNNGANNYDRGFDGQAGVCVVYEYK
jgi:hypothetical protein